MILYLDTSALVKLYTEEAGSRKVRKAVEKARIVSTSRVACVEARAGIARKHREGELSKEEHNRMVDDLVRDWGNYFIVEVSEGVAKLGGELVERGIPSGGSTRYTWRPRSFSETGLIWMSFSPPSTIGSMGRPAPRG